MPRYIAFDVETPNRYNSRMSAIGISVIEDRTITEEYFSLGFEKGGEVYFPNKLCMSLYSHGQSEVLPPSHIDENT